MNAQDAPRRLAAIDIGTVTCRLLVADVDGTHIKELTRRVEITNLGIGVDKTHELQDDGIERVVAQIKEYVSVVHSFETPQFPSIPVRAVATSAARDAKNSQVLVDKLAELGVVLTIIEGTREAALSFRGASRGYEGEHIAVVDIGGGSTEVIFGIAGEAPRFVHSFNIGCRRMTERFLPSNPPTISECEALHRWVHDAMAPVFAEALSRDSSPLMRIVAVAGTATSVVSIDKHMEVYDSDQVHGTVVPRDTLQRIYERLRAMPLEERKQVVGLEPARAGVIVAGLGILIEILSLTKATSFTVSESDILQGILLSFSDKM